MKRPRPLFAIFVSLLIILIGLPPASASASVADRECSNTQRSQAVPAPKGSVALVLSHGWTGSASGLTPIGDAVKQALGSKVAVYYFDYSKDSDRWPSAGNISACLGAFIHNISDKNAVKVVFAAHSMGGIAIRFASSPQYAGSHAVTSKQLAEVVTIDTPHSGSPWGGTPVSGLQQVVAMLKSHGALPAALNPKDAWACLRAQNPPGLIPPSAGVRCATPPYLPPGTALTMVAGQTSIKRTVFGIELYTIPLGGDGIVLDKSMSGYLKSGPTNANMPSGKLRFETATCSDDTGTMTKELSNFAPPIPSSVATDWLRMFADQSAWDDITAGKLTIGSATLWGIAAITAKCSHTHIMEQPEARSAVIEAVKRVAERPKTEVIVMDVYDAASKLRSKYDVERVDVSFGGPVDCSRPSQASKGPAVFQCGDVAFDGAACWKDLQEVENVLCLATPWDTTLRRTPVAGSGVSDMDREPLPLGVELADGTRWALRLGGAWGNYGKNTIAAYGPYRGKEGSTDVLLERDGEPLFTKSNGTWSVLRGPDVGTNFETRDRAKRVDVTKVWFVTGRWQ